MFQYGCKVLNILKDIILQYGCKAIILCGLEFFKDVTFQYGCKVLNVSKDITFQYSCKVLRFLILIGLTLSLMTV